MKTSKLFCIAVSVMFLAVSSFAQTQTITTSSTAKVDSVLVVNPVLLPVPTKIVNVTPVPVSGTVLLGNNNVNVTNTPSVNVTNTPTVNVANLPAVNIATLPAVNINSLPAVQLASGTKVGLDSAALDDGARVPIRLNGKVDLENGNSGGNCAFLTLGSSASTYVVPDGKRLVLQQWSSEVWVETGQKFSIELNSYHCDSVEDRIYLNPPFTYTPTRDLYRGTDRGTYYFDSGDSLNMCFGRSSGVGLGNAFIRTSGYLVDCPAGGCKAVCP